MWNESALKPVLIQLVATTQISWLTMIYNCSFVVFRKHKAFSKAFTNQPYKYSVICFGLLPTFPITYTGFKNCNTSQWKTFQGLGTVLQRMVPFQVSRTQKGYNVVNKWWHSKSNSLFQYGLYYSLCEKLLLLIWSCSLSFRIGRHSTSSLKICLRRSSLAQKGTLDS